MPSSIDIRPVEGQVDAYASDGYVDERMKAKTCKTWKVQDLVKSIGEEFLA